MTELTVEELYDRINRRVDIMLAAGLESEVRSVLPYRHCNSLRTVGYSEMFDYFDGKITFDEAVELIKRNSRRYAKRQITWFGRDKDIAWFNRGEEEQIVKYIDENPMRWYYDELYSDDSKVVLEYTEANEKTSIVDAYCGVGTISLMLAKKAKFVYGIEVVKEAIINAKANAKKNKIDNMVVVGPISSFKSWIDEYYECFGEKRSLKVLNILEPIIFPKLISFSPAIDDCKLTLNSGILVPTLTNVKPITNKCIFFNNSLVYLILSKVFLENLDISFVIIRSNLFCLASFIILKKLVLFKIDVPVIPSSI